MKNIIFMFVLLIVSFFSGCTNFDYGSENFTLLYDVERQNPEENDLKEHELKLMSFNVRAAVIWTDPLFFNMGNWNKRKELVETVLKNHDADILGLQEVMTNNQLKDISSYLSEHDFYAVGRGNRPDVGESCPIFWRKDRFELLDKGTFWFSPTPNRPGSKYSSIIVPRICSWVCLFDRLNDERLYVFNLHLDPFSQSSRNRGMELLYKQISSMDIKDPLIIMGDFNMSKNNYAMSILKNNLFGLGIELRNSWRILDSNKNLPATFHDFNGGNNGPKIDHILVCEKIFVSSIKTEDYSFNGQYPSDHFPVVVETR